MMTVYLINDPKYKCFIFWSMKFWPVILSAFIQLFMLKKFLFYQIGLGVNFNQEIPCTPLQESSRIPVIYVKLSVFPDWSWCESWPGKPPGTPYGLEYMCLHPHDHRYTLLCILTALIFFQSLMPWYIFLHQTLHSKFYFKYLWAVISQWLCAGLQVVR